MISMQPCDASLETNMIKNGTLTWYLAGRLQSLRDSARSIRRRAPESAEMQGSLTSPQTLERLRSQLQLQWEVHLFSLLANTLQWRAACAPHCGNRTSPCVVPV